MKCFYRLIIAFLLSVILVGCAAINPFANTSATNEPTDNIPLTTQSQITRMYASIESGQQSAAAEALQKALQSMDDDIYGDNRQKIAILDRHYSRSGQPSVWEIARQLDEGATSSGSGAAPEALTILDEIEERTEAAKAERPRSFDRDLHRFIQREIRAVAVAMGEDRDFELPRDFVFEIEHYIRKFQTDQKYRDFFQNALRRSRKYIPALRHHFTERGFPEEIMYLAFVESAFNPAARSRANAVGLFQFISSTGKQYGLTINRRVDERKSPHQSAEACAEYLHDLLLELGSFTLALSSYNSGSGKTRQALRQLDDFRDRSFWALRQQTTVLKHETREYVPQIFAAIVAARPGNPRRFGLQDVALVSPSSYESVTIPRSMSLAELAAAMSVDREKLISLNPDMLLTDKSTPAGIIDYPLFVPRGKKDELQSYLNKNQPRRTVASNTRRSSPRSQAQSPVYTDASDGKIVYRVQPGNTLSHLAGWFGCSLKQLKTWNPVLKKRQLRAGDTVIIKVRKGQWQVLSHKVARGETLQQIARKYAVKERSIRSWNGAGDQLQQNQKLIIYRASGGRPAVTPAKPQLASMEHFTSGGQSQSSTIKGKIAQRQKINKGETFLYAVKSGNTLGEIARFFGVTVADIQKWNSFASTQIKSGQKIKLVSGKNFRYFKYKVASGESYSAIAAQFATSELSIRITNGKYRQGLKSGELLTIFAAQ